MGKEDNTKEEKNANGFSTSKGKPKPAKLEFNKEEFKDIPVEKQVEESINKLSDKEGTIFS